MDGSLLIHTHSKSHKHTSNSKDQDTGRHHPELPSVCPLGDQAGLAISRTECRHGLHGPIPLVQLRWAAQAIPVEFRLTWNVNPFHVGITSGVTNLHIRWFRRGESRWPDRADISLTLTSGPPKSLPGCSTAYFWI
ncbi:hypothetical protein CROQUDRAFT_86627 [Cronartium quercuum f. sp. fusiforme G11]|uniref:Uncharacterized protein n=1 Tax=Cronartium quercuum f. sp. fusiforme G11 TaxID=708437 RepID=A0A9P6TH14_9BASI|nr:hypothetical protein CROQUDRAFT_86627 [Cronartium quercuum f. sp. fusiforme G11]